MTLYRLYKIIRLIIIFIKKFIGVRINLNIKRSDRDYFFNTFLEIEFY